MNTTKVAVIVVVTFLTGFFTHKYSGPKEEVVGWKPVYKTHADGSVLEGSTQELIRFLRKGYDLRLAWGWKKEDKSIEHLADPIWIAIINENEVIVHLDPQVLSRVDWENQSANYADSSLFDHEWRVAISTNGSFDAVWYNRVTNKVHRRVPQRHTMTWMINMSGLDNNSDSNPLFLTK